MIIQRQNELKTMAKIAEKAGKKRYELEYMHFCADGSVCAANGVLLSILWNAWTREDGDPEDIFIKIPSTKISKKLHRIKVVIECDAEKNKPGEVKTDTGLLLSCKQGIPYPDVQKILDKFTAEDIVPAANMGPETVWIQQEFARYPCIWLSLKYRESDTCAGDGPPMSLLLTDDASWLIVGAPIKYEISWEDRKQVRDMLLRASTSEAMYKNREK